MTASDPLIKFPCRCGHLFALPADQAASLIQCPRCGLLLDVPGLGELENLSDDGTLLLKPPATHPDPSRPAEAKRFFHPNRLDDAGREIDLRTTPQDLADVGAPPESDLIPLSDDDARPDKPKYDPETGELIRPIPIAPRPDLLQPQDVPVAKRALNYAPADVASTMSPARLLVELCFPANMVVMLFVLVMHVLTQFAGIITLGGLLFIAPVFLGLTALLLAHYGSTIDETGPEERDELPRPIRGLSLFDDIWNPFFHLAAGLTICYLPAWWIYTRDEMTPTLSLVLGRLAALAGTFFFPAVALTLRTSGALNNMRPDRVWGVIRAAGGQYAISVLAWTLTLVLYAGVVACSWAQTVRMYTSSRPLLGHPAIVYPLLFVAIYTAHFFCWHLGLIYRARHADFPWVLQRFISTRAKDDMAQGAAIRAQRRKPRYVDAKTGIEHGK